MDFIVLIMEENKEISIILKRPFLATSRAMIDVQKGELTMRVHDQEVTFNVFKSMQFSNESRDASVSGAPQHLIFQEVNNVFVLSDSAPFVRFSNLHPRKYLRFPKSLISKFLPITFDFIHFFSKVTCKNKIININYQNH